MGDGQEAKVWLDCFAAACEEQGRDYLGRVRYLMADYSPHVLARAQRARERVRRHRAGPRARLPQPDVGPRRPARQAAVRPHLQRLRQPPHRRGHARRRPRLRAARPRQHHPERDGRAGRAARHRAGRDRRRRAACAARRARVLRRRSPPACTSGPTCGTPSTSRRSTSRSRPRRPCASRRAPTSISTSSSTGCRNGRASTCRRWRRRASRRRCSCCTTRASSWPRTCSPTTSGQYASFRGPGKLEGSIVNWINAPIFQLIGERSGFEVTVEPFAYREGSNISVLSARHRDAYRRPSGDQDDHELATEARDAGFGAVVA